MAIDYINKSIKENADNIYHEITEEFLIINNLKSHIDKMCINYMDYYLDMVKESDKNRDPLFTLTPTIIEIKKEFQRRISDAKTQERS